MTVSVMVDLETWGLTPGSDIRSIGAVVFDPVAGTLGQEFYVNVRGGRNWNLTRDPSTVEWWSKQTTEAQQALDRDRVLLHPALDMFADWWNDLDPPQAGEDPATFWANGPHFDEAILAACYRATGQTVPWHYRAPRDFRTIIEAAGGVDLPFEGVQHDALADAKHQARCVIEAYQRINGWRDWVAQEAM